MSLTIIESGFMTMLQDYGRFGWHQSGITQGGPMDEHAFLWANKLLQNEFNAPQLEVCMGGFSARFEHDTRIVVCGAEVKVTLNEQVIQMWQTHLIHAGDEIHIGTTNNGLYVYLAVQDGFQTALKLGSVSTVMREGLGGLQGDGAKLSKGDSIEYLEQMNLNSMSNSVIPNRFLPKYPEEITLRFMVNQTSTACSAQVVEDFVQQQFIVSSKINRMGYRLAAQSKIDAPQNSLISQGVSMGAIQLPPDGEPIVLMKDKQTIGGYSQIGCLAYLDIAKLSQCKSGTKLRFAPIELNSIEQEFKEYLKFFAVKIAR